MKTVCKLNQCAGCKACLDICKKNAISIVDSLSAMNASIDENLCVNCGACEKVCPNNSVLQMKRPQEWYQGWVDATRQTSSSGGVATGLMESFIRNGGYVAAFLKMVNLFLILQMT